MIILHVANLTDDKTKGPNTNVPKNIIYGNKYADVALYNLTESKIALKIPKGKLYNISEYKKMMELPEPYNKPDIVIFQGVYFIKYCKIANQLSKNNIPYIIIPRCSMTTAALKSHNIKKKVANILFFNKFIKNARSIQFLTKNEYEESKNNFKFSDYFILSNGIELPSHHYIAKNRNQYIISFIGRYNVYHKGLDILLETITENKKWFIDNHIIVYLYGSDSDNGLLYLNKKIDEFQLKEIVKIKGPVFGIEKEEAILNSDVFIHTSRLEGQPTSVIEAISYGVPVIVTPGTNISDIVEENNLGFTAKQNANSIFEAIKKSYEEKSSFKEISKREIKYSTENFEWEKIIKKSLSKYK